MQDQQKNEQFLSVLERHKGIVFKIAHAYCKDAADRNDLIQEITLQLWKSFDTYNPQYQYSTWIYRIALNVSISFYRKTRQVKAQTDPISEQILNFADTHAPPETEPRIKMLYQFISALKDLDKALILLYLEEKPYKEIAEIMGISESNVATKIGRIKAFLKQQFAQLNNQ